MTLKKICLLYEASELKELWAIPSCYFHTYPDATRVSVDLRKCLQLIYPLSRAVGVRRGSGPRRRSRGSGATLGSPRPRNMVWARDKLACAPLPVTVITLAATCFYRLLNWGELSAQNQTQLMMPLCRHSRQKPKKIQQQQQQCNDI